MHQRDGDHPWRSARRPTRIDEPHEHLWRSFRRSKRFAAHLWRFGYVGFCFLFVVLFSNLIASTGVLLGWGVRDSVFLVVVGSGGATRRHPSCSSSGETNGLHMPRRARRDPSCSSSDETDGHYMPRRPAATHRVQVRTKPTVTTCQEKPAAIHRV